MTPLCNTLLSDGQDIVSCILRTRRGHSPSTLVIKSLNTVATETKRAYLYGVQDDLLDFRDGTRLTGQVRAMSRKISTKLQPELIPNRSSRRDGDPTCRVTEAVHLDGPDWS